MKVAEVLRAFQKLGMQIREGRDTLAFFYCGDRLVLWTKVPHKRGELKGKLPYYIRQQLRKAFSYVDSDWQEYVSRHGIRSIFIAIHQFSKFALHHLLAQSWTTPRTL